MSFSNLGLSDKVLAAVTAAGYTTPTPIQEQAIPHVLARRDVLGIAQTGTGKTAAFVLPMLTMLEQGRARARMPRTLILEPTRELAAQVEESFDKYGKNHKLNVALIIGGVSFDDQDSKLMRGVDVLIATPGRLLDHSERGRLLMTGVELLVIDEADRMLDMGFIPDIERICKLVPFTRQTLFFTATMPPEIQRITEQFLHNPVRVEVSRPATTVAAITQQLVKTGREPHDKRDTLRRTDPRGRQVQERHHLLQPQARSRAAAPLAGAPRLQRRRAARRPGPVGAHRRARCSSAAAKPSCWSPPTSPPAGSTFRTSATSSISTCRIMPTTTSTASAAPAAPARPAPRSPSSAPADGKAVAAIEKLIGQTHRLGRARCRARPRTAGAARPRRTAATTAASRAATIAAASRHRQRGHRGDRREQRQPAARRHEPQPGTPPEPAATSQRAAAAARRRSPGIDEARHRQAPRPAARAGRSGHRSHLPAFLLRPVRVKA